MDDSAELKEMEVDGEIDESELQEADADELDEHAEQSGYYRAVPAAAAEAAKAKAKAAAKAAGGYQPRMGASSSEAAAAASFGRRTVPGAAISIEEVAKLMMGSDVKPSEVLRWKEEYLKVMAAKNAIMALTSRGYGADIFRSCYELPAYATEDERDVPLPDSVSLAGLEAKEATANICAAKIGPHLNVALKSINMAMEEMYQTAKANHQLRHYQKKFAAQTEMRKAAAAAKHMKFNEEAQFKMQKSAVYQERQKGQAEKRKKSSTKVVKRDRFAEVSNL